MEKQELASPTSTSSWWEIGTAWVSIAAVLRSGEIEAEIRKVGAATARSTGAIRIYAASCEFVAKLRRLASDRSGPFYPLRDDIEALRDVPALDISSLRRVSHFGEHHLLELIPLVARRECNGNPLLRREREIRKGQEIRLSESASATVRRLRNVGSRNHALRAVTSPNHLNHTEITWKRSDLDLDPIYVDAVGRRREASGFVGMRIMAAAAKTSSEPRIGTVVMHGLAGARIFDSFMLLVENEADVTALTRQIERFGPCGLGIMLLEPGKEAIPVVYPPRRDPFQRPDLAARYELALDGLFVGV